MAWNKGDIVKETYEIEDTLGEGYFGITYKARNIHIGKYVVLKTLNEKRRSERDYIKYSKRFKKEGQHLNKVAKNDNPHIVGIIDFFTEGDLPCLVMDYVEGKNLYDLIQEEGRLSEERAVKYIRQIGSALKVCHEVGIIHRDAYPSNIMLRKDGNAVLIDFGISKVVGNKTQSANLYGNIAFAPYEQIWGQMVIGSNDEDEDEEIGATGEGNQGENEARELNKLVQAPTIDIYTLAASLYYLVTGNSPCPSQARKYLGEKLKAPKKYNPKLSELVDEVIKLGMAVEPEDRPQSMEEWLRLLPEEGEIPPEDSLEIKCVVECEIKNYSNPVLINNHVRLVLEDVIKYRRSGISELETWCENNLNDIVERIVLEKSYVDLLVNFQEDEQEIKRLLQVEVESIGYSVEQLVYFPQLEHFVLKDDFNIEIEQEEFSTRDAKVKVQLSITVEAKFEQFDKILEYLDRPVDEIKNWMIGTVNKTTSEILSRLQPEIVYMGFYEPATDEEVSVEQKLKDGIKEALETEWKTMVLNVIPVLEETEIVDFLENLKISIGYFECEVELQEGEIVTLTGNFQVIGVKPNSWDVFQSKFQEGGCKTNYIRMLIENTLKINFDTFDNQIFINKTLEELVFNAAICINKSIVDEYGLKIEISNLTCSLTKKKLILPSLMETENNLGIDYTKLHNLLAARKWKEADKETRRVMLAIVNREEEGWLNYTSIENFPRADLQTIDQLWVKYSSGYFGFSVQKAIYESSIETKKYDNKIINKFASTLGWRLEGKWIDKGDLVFDRSLSQKGHLPTSIYIAYQHDMKNQYQSDFCCFLSTTIFTVFFLWIFSVVMRVEEGFPHSTLFRLVVFFVCCFLLGFLSEEINNFKKIPSIGLILLKKL